MNSKVLRTAICLSWITLVACFIIKSLGGDFFQIPAQSTWIDEHLWADILVCSVSSYILFSLYYLAICEVSHFPWWIHVGLIPYFALMTFLKLTFIPYEYYIMLDLISNFAIPTLLIMVMNGKPQKEHRLKYFRILVAFVLNCGFQAISVMVRNPELNTIVASTLSELLMTVDVVIMLLLYWLYSLLNKKEEVNQNG